MTQQLNTLRTNEFPRTFHQRNSTLRDLHFPTSLYQSCTSCAVKTRTFFYNISPIDNIIILLILEQLKIKIVVAAQQYDHKVIESSEIVQGIDNRSQPRKTQRRGAFSNWRIFFPFTKRGLFYYFISRESLIGYSKVAFLLRLLGLSTPSISRKCKSGSRSVHPQQLSTIGLS